MKTIHKYRIRYSMFTAMPLDAKIISVGAQGVDIFCWAITDPQRCVSQGMRLIDVYGTGHAMKPEPGKFIRYRSDGLVFHIFDRGFNPIGG